MTTLTKKFVENDIWIFELFNFNFSRLTHDFRINKLFIEN